VLGPSSRVRGSTGFTPPCCAPARPGPVHRAWRCARSGDAIADPAADVLWLRWRRAGARSRGGRVDDLACALPGAVDSQNDAQWLGREAADERDTGRPRQRDTARCSASRAGGAPLHPDWQRLPERALPDPGEPEVRALLAERAGPADGAEAAVAGTAPTTEKAQGADATAVRRGPPRAAWRWAGGWCGATRCAALSAAQVGERSCGARAAAAPGPPWGRVDAAVGEPGARLPTAPSAALMLASATTSLSLPARPPPGRAHEGGFGHRELGRAS